MAEDGFVNNGVDNQYSEEFVMKMKALEELGELGPTDELLSENTDRSEEIKKLKMELEGLRSSDDKMRKEMEGMEREVLRLHEFEKSAEVIAARAAELETELARLQHDSILEMNAAEEARMEASELRKVLGEKESRVEYLEREMEGLKKVKVESETKLRDLERKIGVLETKEIEERNKRIRVEEEFRDNIDEKEREIRGFRLKVEDMEKVIAESKSELEERGKLNLEEALRKSEEKVASLESNIAQLREEIVEAEKVISSLNEKSVETVNGGVNGIHGEGNGLKLQWPLVAATGAVVAGAAVIYVCHGKRL
ncbi:peroxisomal and mitochondrial division factor 2 [Gastrolobium bilobum]|uniref:peroxisomal and mitochondrial division factor 2 n=1 Tax=Gastrolobium bilobum TaxID=150636 RepID=UPI002AB31EA2|nr:peroxisomal and mitochondrial division factor 2 [Gastrolobium bilobum]XP_061369840.1 peroxisomal and mitochondrial division factor 2 [Gastrolobium bilobum]XP_061369841.1 peroxisomal and mitochondrial division factor 2 [Gastrolobium bilobum]